MNKADLITERDALQRKLEWLGVKSTGSDRIEMRIREIDREMGQSYALYKPPQVRSERFNRLG